MRHWRADEALATRANGRYALACREPGPRHGTGQASKPIKDQIMTDIRTIGVIGAGQMGNGIAHVAALAGYDVLLNDLSEDRLVEARSTSARNMHRQASRGLVDGALVEPALARIGYTAKIGDFAAVDLAIEAASENADIKRAIFKDLCPVLRPDALIASNTSSISITRLGASTDRPEQFIGLHFMNPVPLMKLVEVIRGLATNQGTYDAALTVAHRMGKTVTNAEDFPAFIVNRILIPMINEAVYTLYEGVGTVDSIDKAMKLGANHPMGPLELADFIGLDTILSIMQVLNEGLADTKYRPCPLLVKYVEAGWLGKKTNRGFYDYRGEAPVPTR
jgi:3-hydroxybutyryl-CoA dehydrogenase